MYKQLQKSENLPDQKIASISNVDRDSCDLLQVFHEITAI